MGTLNSRVQFVQTPIAGVVLSHLRTLRLRSGIVISFWKQLFEQRSSWQVINFKAETRTWATL